MNTNLEKVRQEAKNILRLSIITAGFTMLISQCLIEPLGNKTHINKKENIKGTVTKLQDTIREGMSIDYDMVLETITPEPYKLHDHIISIDVNGETIDKNDSVMFKKVKEGDVIDIEKTTMKDGTVYYEIDDKK